MSSTRLGQIAQEVSAQNPWWRDPHNWAASDLDLRDARNSGLTYRSTVLDDLEPGNVYLLRGPRRVGKTVAVKELVERLLASGTPASAIIRVAVDGWAAKDLRTLTQNSALPPIAPGQHHYWLLDEVTGVTGDWASQIKWMRDNLPEFKDATVVLTGSSAIGLTAAVGTIGGRRGTASNLDRTMLPMGFRTFVNQVLNPAPTTAAIPLGELRSPKARDAYRALAAWLDDLVRLWERYTTYGGYPVAVSALKAGQMIPARFVDDLFDIVAHDAFQASNLSTAKELALLDRLAETISTPANISNIAQDLDIGRDVVGRHIEYLRDAYLLWECPRRDRDSWLAAERGQSKLYPVDPLIARLSHLKNPNRDDVDITKLTEMQLGNAVRRRVIADHPECLSDTFVFHERTPARKEIDFLSEQLAGVAIEGKYTQGAWRGDAATVNASTWDGILATRNVLDVDEHKNAWAVPAGVLAYVLDT